MYPIVVDATRRSCRERARPARGRDARLNFSSTREPDCLALNRKTDTRKRRSFSYSDKNSGMSISITVPAPGRARIARARFSRGSDAGETRFVEMREKLSLIDYER